MLSQRSLQHCLGTQQHPLLCTRHQPNSWRPSRTPLHLQRHANTALHGHQQQQQARSRVKAPAASASEVLTPHSGYHFDGTNRRFFEGWYFKVTIPENGQSFALIYSIEDPGDPSSPVGGVGVQVMGPDDGYICQFSKDVGTFWASRNNLELGATFKQATTRRLRQPVSEAEFSACVREGFQARPTWHQGNVVAAERGAAGPVMSTVPSCSWSFSVAPKVGWGDSPTAAARPEGGTSQKATAGWLSMLSVFEPHWQVLMAEGRASGWLQWGEQRYEFSNAPAYAEKNWGGGFPSKWIWVQCNTFDVPGLSITAVGARRQLILGVPGVEEDVGMLGIHLPDGTFLELVPWAGQVEWNADPWGKWQIWARARGYEALLEASCTPEAGTVLRAPTANNGLAPHCKDTFFGKARLRIWRTGSNGSSGGGWSGSSAGCCCWCGELGPACAPHTTKDLPAPMSARSFVSLPAPPVSPGTAASSTSCCCSRSRGLLLLLPAKAVLLPAAVAAGTTGLLETPSLQELHWVSTRACGCTEAQI